MSTPQLTIIELAEGREAAMNSAGEYTSLTQLFKVSAPGSVPDNFSIDTKALEAVRLATPAVKYDMPRASISLSERVDALNAIVRVEYTAEDSQAALSEDEDIWTHIHIGRIEDEDEDDSDSSSAHNESSEATVNTGNISIESTSCTEHWDRSLQTINSFGDAPKSYAGKLGADAEGNVAGIDVATSEAVYTETHYFSRKKFNLAYIKTLFNLVKCVNSHSFRGFAAGTLQFDSFSASRPLSGSSSVYTVTFKFIFRPWSEAVSVDGQTIPAHSGFDYASIFYEPVVGTMRVSGEPVVVKKATGGFVERIFKFADFNALRLPNISF